MSRSRSRFGFPSQPRAFTLIELLVVVGIIGLLVGILLPVLSRARAAAESARCLSNLHQLGIATAQYESETKGFLPYPTRSLSGDNKAITGQDVAENMVWYNVLDPDLQSLRIKANYDDVRRFTAIKQCPVWLSFGAADPNRVSTTQDPHELTRTYKMNTHLRHNNAAGLPSGTDSARLTHRPAKVAEVPDASNFVYLGDGIGIDTTGPIGGSGEWTNFDFEVNRVNATGNATNPNPSLRHSGGANILFVDKHAAHVTLKKSRRTLNGSLAAIAVDTWQPEYLNAATGKPTVPGDFLAPLERQTPPLKRNPNMPLQWSQLGKLYAPPGT